MTEDNQIALQVIQHIEYSETVVPQTVWAEIRTGEAKTKYPSIWLYFGKRLLDYGICARYGCKRGFFSQLWPTGTKWRVWAPLRIIFLKIFQIRSLKKPIQLDGFQSFYQIFFDRRILLSVTRSASTQVLTPNVEYESKTVTTSSTVSHASNEGT